jgi:hypothetical protein
VLDRKSASSTHIRCSTTLMRRARATMARIALQLRATCAPHVLSQVESPRCIMTVVALHSARCRLTSLALIMPPETSRSPDGLRDGVIPTHGPTFFEEVNRERSSTVDR